MEDRSKKIIKTCTGVAGLAGGLLVNVVVTTGLNAVLPGSGTVLNKTLQTIGTRATGLAAEYAFQKCVSEFGDNLISASEMVEEMMESNDSGCKIKKEKKKLFGKTKKVTENVVA